MMIVTRDHAPARAALVDALARECGIPVLRLATAAPWPRGAAGQRVIWIEAARRAPALEPQAIRAASARGAIVVVIEDGHPLPSIGERCQFLLAGAHCVLDASSPDFAAALRATLTAIVGNDARKNADDLRLRNSFARFGLVGLSEATLAAFRRVEKISRFSDLPALILGETGTGKELIARAIHQLDPKRRAGSFVAVNCAAIQLGLAESELFGHRKGAFTGADRERKGLIRAADGGVLFLDEIGDLHPALQGKLLRVLQERRVLGLGEDRETEVDVRVVAATHRDLRQMVDGGQFREDLYHRLKLLPVELTPLRSRPDDLPLLVEHFIARNAPHPVEAGSDFLEALAGMGLRGNARELENLVRFALIECRPGATLGLADLPPDAWNELGNAAKSADAPRLPVPDDDLTLSELLARCEKLTLEAAMRKAHNNQSQAAVLLGITPRSVYNKLRRHQIHL
jgi:transcriptional regulator with GAF, ATPase, and Fis domain